MQTIEESIEVDAPVRTVYNQWTQFETFPHFMEGVEEVVQKDPTHLHWRAKVAGKELEWDAEITEQVPDSRISWRETAGERNSGTVTFHSISPTRTRITLRMGYEPQGAVENIGSAMGVLKRRVKGDLERFKDFLHERGTETGAWRGSVQGGRQVDRGGAGDLGRESGGRGPTDPGRDVY